MVRDGGHRLACWAHAVLLQVMPNVRLLLPGMVLGIGVGWATLWLMFRACGENSTATPTEGLNLAIGLIAVGFVALHLLRWLRGDIRAFRPVLWHGLLAGSSAGFVSTLAHTAGPITNMFLLPQQMTKGRFVATTVLYYWIGNQVKLVPYFGLGLLTAPTMSADLSLLPAVVIGAMLGIFLHNRVNEKLFLVIVYVLLGGIGLHMAITAAAALLR